MPSPSSPMKRPGMLSWIGYGLVVFIAVIAVGTMLKTTLRPSMHGSVTSNSYGIGGEAGMPAKMQNLSASLGYLASEEGVTRDMAIAPTSPMPPIMQAPGGSAATDLDGNAIAPRVIKTAELTLRVTDAPKTVEDVRAYVGSKNGFVESSSLSDSGSGPRSAYLTVRVPVDTFEQTMRDLKQFATLVVFENVHGQDVTADFVDLEADLRNAQAEEASYLEILKRSGDIDDVLAVTQRLADVRGRIERLEGRKRYLSNRTDLATITLTLTEDTRIEAPTPTWRPFQVLKDALHDLVISLQELVNFLIQSIVAIIGLLLPIVLIVGFVMWIGWKIVLAVLKRFR